MTTRRILAFSLLLAAGFARHAQAGGPYVYYTVTPCRLVDTRDVPNAPDKGPALAANAARAFPIYGPWARNCSIPTDAKAVTVNATIIGPPAPGHMILFPYNTPVPNTSALNFNANEPALGNGQVIGLTTDAYTQLSVYLVGSSAHFTLDITGYFKAP